MKFKKTKIGLIPEDWEEIVLNSFIKEGKNYSNDKNIAFGSLTIEYGIIEKPPQYNREHLVKNSKNPYKIIKYGDFVYNPMNLRFGALGLYKGNKPLKVSSYYNIFRVNTNIVDMNFMYYFLKSKRILHFYNRMATGSLEEKKRIHFRDFLKFSLPLPPLKEQQKIAEILSTCDEAIEKQEKLIKEKEKLKKGLMQRLLKVEGKKREPKVRFKEFSGEWVDVDLEGLVNSRDILLGRGEVISKKDIENIKGNYPIYSSSTKNNGLFGYYGKYMFDEELITWSIDGGGDFFYRPKHKFSITNVSGFIKVLKKGKINTYFLALILQYKKQFLHFDYQSKAHPSVIKKLYKFYIPPTLKEQEKIADVLLTIDKEINLLKLELNELKKQKKALMQKLLTGKVRVRV